MYFGNNDDDKAANAAKKVRIESGLPSSAVAMPTNAKTGDTKGVSAMFRKRSEIVLQVRLCDVPC